MRGSQKYHSSTSMKQKAPLPLFDTIDYLPSTNRTDEQLKYYIKHVPFPYAQNDYYNAVTFLRNYESSPDTFATYRKEIERFLQWCWYIAFRSIKDVSRIDLENYIRFCIKPPAQWIGTKTVARFRNQQGLRVPNEDWRPFVYKVSKAARRFAEDSGNDIDIDKKKYFPSDKSITSTLAVLSTFYNYLIGEQYTDLNPVRAIRPKDKFTRRTNEKRKIRRLSDTQWRYVIGTAANMADSDPEEHERTLFVMSLLYGLYLRISELAAYRDIVPSMKSFSRDQNGQWWFATTGKGNKYREIAVSDSVLDSLSRYRMFLKLPPLPTPDDDSPLIRKHRGKLGMGSTRQIRNIVQNCFDEAVISLRKASLHEEADNLLAATVHWLRHTGISDDVKNRPIEHVRDDAGHKSSATTDLYIDIEKRERHESAKNKLI